jgi:hypothetical protein
MRTVQTDSVCIISVFSDKYYFLQEKLDFGREGNNYYSFRIIIRINKNKKKEKLVILVLGIFTQNRHKPRNLKHLRQDW